MLVICNGAPKGGSTWLVQIIIETNLFKRIPDKYQNTKWFNSSIDNSQFEIFFSEALYKSENYFIKQHWYNNEKFLNLTFRKDIRMLNIVRDIRDVLVSRYFHDLRLGRTAAENVESYYWHDKGKKSVNHYIRYHKFWNELTNQGNVFRCSYESLKTDFLYTVSRMFEFIDINFSASQINDLEEKTSIKNKKFGPGKFFRKGIVGDWKNHLSMAIIEDLDRLCNDTGYYLLNIQDKCSV
jgi:hypothetical protein